MKYNFKGLLKLSAWEDVPGTPLDASRPYVTKNGPKPGEPVVIPETIKDFFNDIQFPTKQEFGGRPGIDYNDSKYRNGFWNDAKIYYGDKDSEGITWPWGSLRIPITDNGQLDESTLVHELQHYMDRDSVPFVQSGRSRADNAKLQSGYAFNKSDMVGYIPGTKWYAKKIEPSSTNAEYRYKLYKQLLRENMKAGKGKPTYEQFKEYIRTLPADQLVQYYSRTPNMYAESLVNRQKPTLNATQPTLPKNLGSMPPAIRTMKKHEYMQRMREWNKRTNILNNLRRALIEVAQTRKPQGTAIV